MSGFASRESMSRCEQPSNLYDTIRRTPPAKPTLVNFADKSKDTLESTQQRLNREMLERMQSKGLQLPHESFVAVTQVGKYLFLAIMLPPYLALYGLPRWLLLTMLPQMFDEGKAAALIVGRFMVEMSKYVSDLMKGILEQLLGNAMRMTKHQGKKMWRHLSDFTQGVSDAVLRNLERAGALKDRLKDAFKQFSINFFNQLNHALHGAREWASSKAADVASAIAHGASKTMHFADRAFITPVVNLLTPPATFAITIANAIRNKLVSLAEESLKRLRKFLEPAVSAIEKAGEWTAKQAAKLAEKFIDPLAAWMEAKKETLENFMHRNWKRVADPIADVAASIKAKVEERFNSAIVTTKQIVTSVTWAVQQTMKWGWGAFRKRMQHRQETLKRWGGATRQLAKGFVAGIKAIGAATKSAIARSHQKTKKFALLLLHLVRWIVGQIMLLPRKLLRSAKVIWKVFAVIMNHMVFAIRITIAIFWAGCSYGLIVLRKAIS